MKPNIDMVAALKKIWPGVKRKKNEKGIRAADLRLQSFGLEPAVPKKKASLLELKNRIQQQRQIRRAGYDDIARKERKWHKLVPVCMVVLALVVLLAFDGTVQVQRMLSGLSFFKVRTLTFTGCTTIPEERLKELAGISLYHTSLVGMDIAGIEQQLGEELRVSRAKVSRIWPSTVAVDIVERRPIALMNVHHEDGPQLFYIDKQGRSYQQVLPGQDVDFPVITGLDGIEDARERQSIFSDIVVFLGRAGRNDPNLPAQSVSEVHINEQGEMVVFLVEHPFPIFFGRGEIAAKYSRLVSVLETLYKNPKNGVLLSQIEYIRMNYLDDKVLVAQGESG